MNWGKGLIIGLVAFMIFITVLVVKMFNTAEDSFDKDYYEKGLTYDVDYQQKQQVITDKATPKVTQTGDYVSIHFNVVDSGVLKFKRPSNQKKDQAFTFKSSKVLIPKSNFAKGEWRLIIHWYANNKKYLFETNLYMP